MLLETRQAAAQVTSSQGQGPPITGGLDIYTDIYTDIYRYLDIYPTIMLLSRASWRCDCQQPASGCEASGGRSVEAAPAPAHSPLTTTDTWLLAAGHTQGKWFSVSTKVPLFSLSRLCTKLQIYLKYF